LPNILYKALLTQFFHNSTILGDRGSLYTSSRPPLHTA